MDSKQKKKKRDIWFVKAFVIAFALTMVFGILSEKILVNTSWQISIVVIIVLLSISLFFDMIGTAIIVVDPIPFNAMASKKIKGARNSIKIVKAQNMLASIFCDVIGDIGGILSGAMGVGLALALQSKTGAWYDEYISVFISALIAGFSISVKALLRMFAKRHSHTIVKKAGQLLSIFVSENRKSKSHSVRHKIRESKNKVL